MPVSFRIVVALEFLEIRLIIVSEPVLETPRWISH